jgi:DUF1680 family protein
MKTRSYLSLLLVALALPLPAAPISLLQDKVPSAIADRQDYQIPDRVQIGGWVGERMTANESNRLARIDVDRLLEGYRKRPGRQTWDGEHVGKWLHAATLAWAHTGDAALRQKLDHAVEELAKCQLEDGYLGTYTDDHRWTEWDVWAHKYNLLGLLTYIQYTGNETPMATCRRMADLLCRTFGEAPGQKDLLKAGFHMGMAPTSVLEPMVLLYRATGEQRYRDFCDYILRTWESPGGPHIISRLLELKGVAKVGNAKAYEMLSCLNGALEYHRTFGGDQRILEACLLAWQDVVDNQLYVTGTASSDEHFRPDHELPNTGKPGETCVTVTWLQFNAQLLRLTGEARFADQLQHVILNQLFGAQRPDGKGWCYYVPLEGRKTYAEQLDGQCCLSSGPRGVALVPTFAVSTDADGVVVNLYSPGRSTVNLRDGTSVTLFTETAYPREGRIAFTLQTSVSHSIALKLPIPKWCENPSLTINGEIVRVQPGSDGYVALRRKWLASDRVELTLPLKPRLIVGNHTNMGSVAVAYGPLILAADEAIGPAELKNIAALAVVKPDSTALGVVPEAPPRNWAGTQVFRAHAVVRSAASPGVVAHEIDIGLVPFADAGRSSGRYAVWLPLLSTPGFNLAKLGEERFSRSYAKRSPGALIDGDAYSPGVIHDETLATEDDWFAVILAEPAAITRVVVCQWQMARDRGGWFDTSVGKPRIQLQRVKDGAWETVGELSDYPATDAVTLPSIPVGSRFTLNLPRPVHASGVRVIGAASRGKATDRDLLSCSELEVYAN